MQKVVWVHSELKSFWTCSFTGVDLPRCKPSFPVPMQHQHPYSKYSDSKVSSNPLKVLSKPIGEFSVLTFLKISCIAWKSADEILNKIKINEIIASLNCFLKIVFSNFYIDFSFGTGVMYYLNETVSLASLKLVCEFVNQQIRTKFIDTFNKNNFRMNI